MVCRRSKPLMLLVGVSLALISAQIATAQRGGGRGPGGRNMISKVDLAAHDKVQTELNMTEEQKQQVADIRASRREAMRNLRDQQEGNRREAMQKIAEDSSAKLAEVLDDDQEKRLAGILVQVDLMAAMDEPYVAEQLNLTDEQQAKLERARNANWRAMSEAFQGFEDLSREERRAKMQEARSTAEKNVIAVLTPEQQATLDELKGEPVEIDRRELFGGRGGRGRRGSDQRN